MPDFVNANAGPYASAAADSFGSMLRAVQGLREAAQQQQKLAGQQRLQQFDAEIKMRQDGYQPAEVSTGGTLATGLGHREPVAGASQDNTIVDPWGRRWYKPEKADKAPITLNEALERGGTPVDAQGNISMGDAGGLSQTPASSLVAALSSPLGQVAPPAERVFQTQGGPRMYMPTQQEQQGDKDRAAAAKSKTEEDAKNYQLPDAITARLEEKSGLPAGTLKGVAVPRSELRELLGTLNPKEGGAAPHIDTEHFNVPVLIDAKTQKVTPLELPKGVTRTLTPGQQDTQQRFEERQQDRKDAAEQKRRDGAQKAIDALQQKEQAQHESRRLYGEALNTPDNGVLIDPDTKKQVPMTAARRAYYQNRYNKASDLAQIYHAQQGQVLGGVNRGGQPQQDTGQSAPPQGPPQRREQYNPGPATRTQQAQQGGPQKASRGKLTNQAVATAYLRKAGGDKNKARQLAKADGWEF